MKKIMIENLGKSNPADFDFCLGNPVFLADGDKLRVVINDGTSMTSTVLELPKAEEYVAAEVLHPSYPENVPEGAYYFLFGDPVMNIDLCEDGLYFWAEDDEPEFFSFDDDFESVEALASAINVDALTLSALLI